VSEREPGVDPAVTPMLEVTNLSKSFSGHAALSGLDLTVEAGEVRCLVGGNGSGKSTFIKILSGYHQPDPGGEVRIGGELLNAGHPRASHRLGARFVHQDLGLIEDASISDNLFLGSSFPTRFGALRDREARRRCSIALQRLELDVDPRTLVRDLPAAERTGVAIARAVADEEWPIKLIVLDEPTATLPATEVGVLLRMVKGVAQSGVGVLYVTHRLEEVFEIGSRVTVLRNGRKVLTRSVTGLSREALLTDIVGTEVLEVHRDAAQAPPRRPPALRVRELSGNTLGGVSFEVAPGEILGISGVTGSGREELNASIFGSSSRHGGAVDVGDSAVPAGSPAASIRAGAAYLPPDRRALGGMMSLSGTENLTITTLKDFWSVPSLRHKEEKAEAERWWDRLSIQPPGAWGEPITLLSGGNQQKVLLGKWLRLEPRVLLLDEPTQGVDVAATAEIYRQLLTAAEQGAAIVVSTTDTDELVALCSRVLILADGRFVAELTGPDVNVASITSWSLAGVGTGKAAAV
jgi:ribose transport system ATP-binding protein